MVKAKKTYKAGGKVVAQGADKKDVRREKKQDRIASKAAKKLAKARAKTDKRWAKKGYTRLGESSIFRKTS